MDIIQKELQSLGIPYTASEKIREKDGVTLCRVAAADQSYILKIYANEADKREIKNYLILQTLGLQTLKILGSTDSALLMEDVAQSKTLRLGQKDDMNDNRVAARLADWYQELHKRGKAYVMAHGKGMYDETDAITRENINAVAAKTETADNPVWALLLKHFDAVSQKIQSMERTLTYNDFYYTNMIVAKDKSAAFMFDYNLLGKGYVYADLRNVTSSLGQEAGQAFLRAYGGFDPNEALADAVASPLTTLHMACQRQAFPKWAEEELAQVQNGSLEKAVRLLLEG